MLLPIYLFLMIYAPKIAGLYDVVGVVSAVIIVHAFFKTAVEPVDVKRLRLKSFALFGFLLLYSAFLTIANQNPGHWQVIRFIRIIVHFMGGYALMRLYYVKYYDRMGEKVLVHLFWAIATHAVIMLLMFISPAINSFIMNTLKVTLTREMAGVRVRGLTASLDALSGLQGFGVIIFPFVIRYLRGFKAILGSVAVVLIACSVLISGRTGIVLVMLLFPITFLFTMRYILGTIVKIGVASVFFVILISLVVPRLDVWYKIVPTIERTKQLISSSEEGGGLKSGVIQKLMNDYKTGWPSNPALFLFGNSTSGRTDWYFVPHDPGYILDVYGVGMFGSLLILSFYFMCIRCAVRCIRSGFPVGMAALLFAVQTLLIHGKVHYLLARNSFTVSVVFLVLTVYLHTIQSDLSEYGDEYLADLADEQGSF